MLFRSLADKLAKEASTYPITDGNTPKIPFTQLLETLQTEALKLWQNLWDTSETGRSIYNVFPHISNNKKNLNRSQILLILEHGPFPSYKARFRLSPSGNCSCGNPGTVKHYVLECPLTSEWHITSPHPSNYKLSIIDPIYKGKSTELINYLTKYSTEVQGTYPPTQHDSDSSLQFSGNKVANTFHEHLFQSPP